MKQIVYLAELGRRLKSSSELQERIKIAEEKNPWFVESFANHAFNSIIHEMLSEKNLEEWLRNYPLKQVSNKTIGLIFAGNIPLVGFHDFLCCYTAGFKMKIKLSSKDDALFPFVFNTLCEIDTKLINKVEIVDKFKDFDAVIATGSNNTNRYFEYYFRDYPKILRKNRNSVAVLKGEETEEELDQLADDVFLYFGFGCRNVSKLYIPVGYDTTRLFHHFEKKYKWLHGHTKYMHNYDYNRAILLLNKTPHYANEFVMLVENASIPSPISSLYYEFWHDKNVLNTHLQQNAEKIQCVVSKTTLTGITSVKFGESQQPKLGDYADGKDTLKFLLKLY